jgi:predicted RNA-binding Zn-ribbon protein involved in translation (DUF1610 family)
MEYTVSSKWAPLEYELGGIKIAVFREPFITKPAERRKTVRAKRPVQQRKVDICPKCNGDGVILKSKYGRNNGTCYACKGTGKRSTVA